MIELTNCTGKEFLARIKQEYVLDLPSVWSELCHSATSSRETGCPDLLTAAIIQAHRLRGNAGAHGCHAVGELAGQIEKSLHQIASGEQSDWTPVLRLLEEGIRLSREYA
jgi:HPt (histidine-containing phosphotransfer) domain-containing protein